MRRPLALRTRKGQPLPWLWWVLAPTTVFIIWVYPVLIWFGVLPRFG